MGLGIEGVCMKTKKRTRGPVQKVKAPIKRKKKVSKKKLGYFDVVAKLEWLPAWYQSQLRPAA